MSVLQAGKAEEEFTGQDALDQLASRWALHDGWLRRFVIDTKDGAAVNVELKVAPRPESRVAEVCVHLTELIRFDSFWRLDDGDFYLVAGYKAFLLDAGSVYLSLDPYDDRTLGVDERDRFVLEARTITARFSMKPKDAQK